MRKPWQGGSFHESGLGSQGVRGLDPGGHRSEPENRLELLRGNRPAEQKALIGMAALAGKKLALGFSRTDELEARVYTNGCQAKVLGVDVNADLALLEVCGTPKQTVSPSFQLNLSKDEKLMLIARPHGDRVVSHGTFYGAYSLKGVDYWSVRISARDGFSGSPVYNEKGEVVGVFSGYDWAQKLAVISPGERAQKLLEAYAPTAKP